MYFLVLFKHFWILTIFSAFCFKEFLDFFKVTEVATEH